VKRDRGSEQGYPRGDSIEYTDADIIVNFEVENESTENSRSRSMEAIDSQLTTSVRNSNANAEPWVKPAATRSRSTSANAEMDLDFPVISTREKKSKQNVSPTNSPIRLVPDDNSRIEITRDDTSRFVPMLNSSASLEATNQDESGAKRMLVAQRLSHELLSQHQSPPARAPQALENPAGWQSIEQELRINLEKCDQLLRRGAVHSARSEVIAGLRRLFRSMDAYRGSFTSEPALDLALTAFREEADFHSPYGVSSVASVVATHTTPALKNCPLEGVSPEVASQHYRVFARDQWIDASAGHRWASDLLYALGKTYEKEAELSSVSSIRLRSQAVICYQSAIRITPTQSEANNQLGYALIHLDRIEEAYDALRSSLESQPNPQAWSNLAEVYRRRGATDSANFAVQQASNLAQLAAPSYTAENPQVTQVDPAIFARYSPAQNVIAPASNANVANGATLATSATQVVKQPNFFSKMFAR
jgi:tetratricopeptide (TPR) repeat protein